MTPLWFQALVSLYVTVVGVLSLLLFMLHTPPLPHTSDWWALCLTSWAHVTHLAWLISFGLTVSTTCLLQNALLALGISPQPLLGQTEVSVHPGTSQCHVLSRLRPLAAGTQKGWRGTKLPAVLCIQLSRDRRRTLFRYTQFYFILMCQDNVLRSYNKWGKITVVVYLAFLFNFRKDRFLKIETQRGGDPVDSIPPPPFLT